jgi:hypothetical protein
MGHIRNADGSLRFQATPNQTVADLQALADRIEAVGGFLRGSAASREELTSGQAKDGWLFAETDTGRLYLRQAGNWVCIWARVRGRVSRSNNPSSFNGDSYGNASANANWTPDTNVGLDAYDAGWRVPVAGRYLVSFEMRASGAFLAGFSVNYSGTAPALVGMQTATPVQNVAATAVATPVWLNAQDIVRPYVLAPSGTTLNLLRATDVGGGGHFSIEWVGAD